MGQHVAALTPDRRQPGLVDVTAGQARELGRLQRHGITVVGSIPAGLPWPALPRFGDVADLLLPAVGVLVVGFTDTVLTARSFAVRTGPEVDANQELLALGAANIGASVLRGFPVSSSASRTALSSAAGGRTQLYSLVTLACVLGVLLFASPLLAQFPNAALGAIIVYAAVRLIDLSEFRRLGAFRRSEFVLAVASMVGVLVVDILYGVLLAIGLSIAALLARVARPHDAVQGVVAASPACTTSTTIHKRRSYPDSLCTATTRLCSSPTPTTSAAGHWPR